MSDATEIMELILLVIVAGLVLLVFGALAYRALRQPQNVKSIAIGTPNGVEEAMFIPVGGIEQWITIRGHDRSNPVLLVIDGGPGAAGSAYIPSRWEEDFVVVGWGQPGAGKTFGRASRRISPDLTIEQVVRDGNDVVQYLCQRFRTNKIGILAVSWGTIVGIHMIKLRPELFFFYVGTGQVVNTQRGEALNYAHVLAKARTKGDSTAIGRLQKMGPCRTPLYALRSWLLLSVSNARETSRLSRRRRTAGHPRFPQQTA